MEEPTRVSKGKAGGETFLSKEVMNSCNGSCHAKRSFFQREKKRFVKLVENERNVSTGSFEDIYCTKVMGISR